MTALRNATALVTGAASGLGRGLCTELHRRGAFVVGLDRDEAGLDALATGLGERFEAVGCDLTDVPALERTAAEIDARQEGVDLLVNNAGVVAGRPLAELSRQEIERTFQVNVLAAIHLTRCLLPGMLERDRGHIVTMASAGGVAGTARLTDYSASKFAAVGFDEALRRELRVCGSRVRTTIVCPYYVDTGMFAGVRTRWPHLLPILRPDDVVARVVRAVERNEPRVVMPRLVHLAGPARLLPVPWMDRLMDWLGVTRSMDHFQGRG